MSFHLVKWTKSNWPDPELYHIQQVIYECFHYISHITGVTSPHPIWYNHTRTMDTPKGNPGSPRKDISTDNKESLSSDQSMSRNVTLPQPGTSGMFTPSTPTDSTMPLSSYYGMQVVAIPQPGTSGMFTPSAPTNSMLLIPWSSDNGLQSSVATPQPGTSAISSSATVIMKDNPFLRVRICFLTDISFVYCPFNMPSSVFHHVLILNIHKMSILSHNNACRWTSTPVLGGQQEQNWLKLVSLYAGLRNFQKRA